MATTIEKIQTLLSKVTTKKEEKEVKFYAEAKLDDGRIVATEEEAMTVGVSVKVLEDDGVAYPLEAGNYALEDGTKLVIAEGGVISSLGEEEAVEEEAVEEEMEKEEDEMSLGKKVYDKFEEISSEEKAEEIINFIKEMMEEEVEEEEMSEETEEEIEEDTKEVEAEDKLEFSSVVGELITRIDSLETKLSEIEEAPAEQGVTVNPTGENYEFKRSQDLFSKISRNDVLRMTTSERAKFMIQNKLTRI